MARQTTSSTLTAAARAAATAVDTRRAATDEAGEQQGRVAAYRARADAPAKVRIVLRAAVRRPRGHGARARWTQTSCEKLPIFHDITRYYTIVWLILSITQAGLGMGK